ncbi:MAG: hypothetical protein EBT20_18855, partial [Alphaproteobacteria bacterium]|nr:hypothetical protein [Alphaproteobacteria bacterium]
KKFLLGMNIDSNQIEILTSPKQFSKVIVPDNSLVDGIKRFKKPWPTGFIESYVHEEYKNITLHIADNLVKKKENTPKKIFFSRKQYWPTIR